MNENATKWVAALRSGKFKQAKNVLRDKLYGEDSGYLAYCCLGVACELSGLGEWVDKSAYRDGTHVAMDAELNAAYPDDAPEFSREEEFASPEVQRWLGLKSQAGDLVLNSEETSLAQLNDKGVPFPEIADIIVANADQLFEPDAIDYMAVVREIARS